jgi:hypothetical protein
MERENTRLKEENILARCHIKGMKERIVELEELHELALGMAKIQRTNRKYSDDLCDAKDARIAELEATQAQSKQNYELEIAHWKRIAEDAQAGGISAMQPSVLCATQHVQNCHFCNSLDCGDNTSVRNWHGWLRSLV